MNYSDYAIQREKEMQAERAGKAKLAKAIREFKEADEELVQAIKGLKSDIGRLDREKRKLKNERLK